MDPQAGGSGSAVRQRRTSSGGDPWSELEKDLQKEFSALRKDGPNGANGNEFVPPEKPLRAILNQNQKEVDQTNGRAANSFRVPAARMPMPSTSSAGVPSSSVAGPDAKSPANPEGPALGAFNLLDKDFTRNTLKVVHGSGSGLSPAAPAIAPNQPTSTNIQSPPSTSAARSLTGRQEEVTKRRNLVDQIERGRAAGRMEYFVPQCEQSTGTQIGMIARRWVKRNPTKMPTCIGNFIMDEVAASSTAAAMRQQEAASARSALALAAIRRPAILSNQSSSASGATIPDPADETDYSDLDDDPKDKTDIKSCPEWDTERIRAGAKDHELLDEIIQCERQLHNTVKALEELEKEDKEKAPAFVVPEGSSARCTQWVDGKYRRTLRKPSGVKTIADYFKEFCEPSTSTEAPTAYSHCLRQLHRLSEMPPFVLRKSVDRAIWLQTKELEEEKVRNGLKRREEREKREKRKQMEDGKEEEKSDSYEDTDESDEYTATKIDMSRKDRNGVSARKKKKRDRRSRLREGDKPPLPLNKLGRRASTMGGSRSSFEHLRDEALEIAEICGMPQGASNMPQNVEYAEIWVPVFTSIKDAVGYWKTPVGSPSRNESTGEAVTAVPPCPPASAALPPPPLPPPVPSNAVPAPALPPVVAGKKNGEDREEDLMLRVARAHHALEHEERRRFHVRTKKEYREIQAASAEGDNKSLPPFAWSAVEPKPWAEETLSSSTGFPPRSFTRRPRNST